MNPDQQPHMQPPLRPQNQNGSNNPGPDIINEDPQYHQQPQQIETIPDTMPRVVHLSRNPSPERPVISDAVRQRHTQSTDQYPEVNLSEAEYVLRDVHRHPIGMAVPVISGVIAIIVILAAIVSYGPILKMAGIAATDTSFEIFSIGAIILCALIGLGTYAAVWVYRQNRFFLTNESVIQNIQVSLFSKREQTINLGNIEDASYTQQGPLQMLLDYGSIRLSTEGDETTYRMTYVAHPKKEVDTLTNAVEAFKNGRPIEDD